MLQIVNEKWTTNNKKLGEYSKAVYGTNRERGTLYIDKNNKIYCHTEHDGKNQIISNEVEIMYDNILKTINDGYFLGKESEEFVLKIMESIKKEYPDIETWPMPI